MKPVNDPALLSQLNGGGVGPKPVMDPALLSQLNGGETPSMDPSEGMPWYEKALVGAGAATSKAIEGVRGLIDQRPNTQADLAKMKEDRDVYHAHHPGGWGTAGELAGDVALTALPIAKVGKVLSKAVPFLGRAAPVVADIAASGGTSAAIAPEDRGEAAAFGAGGAAVGQTLTRAVAGTRNLYRAAVPSIMPTEAAASTRAIKTLERNVDPGELSTITNQLENPLPSMLPRTSAAMSGSPRLGALERGARVRGNADFVGHDASVDKAAWSAVKDATPGAEDVATAAALPKVIFGQGQEELNKIPLSQGNRVLVSKGLRDLRTNQDVLTSTQAQKQIDEILGVMDNPDATLGALAHLRTNVSELPTFPGQGKIKSVLDDTTEARSKGLFSDTLERYGHSKEALKSAQSSQRLRGTFMDEAGTPKTAIYHGEAGVDAVPNIVSAPLRGALAKEVEKDAGEVKYMDPHNVEKLHALADQLRSRDIYKPAEGGGSSTLDLGGAEGVATAALNTGPFWRLRGTLGFLFSGIDNATKRKVDEALLDPHKFLSLMDQKRADQVAAAPWEKAVEAAVRNSGTIGGAVGSAVGAQ